MLLCFPQNLSLARLRVLVVDEADLMFSYGYKDDTSALIACLPAVRQTLLVVRGLCGVS